ncbi:CbrC family protein [Streptomyces sp. I05A-00742]|uniref:CbrC family protein n=1 Tax=Streptomyces sp. I05A-00742 TaxID=2732853 RepID=UPI001487DB0C|nr:CbrC family protein [Streptomyces sp. I05A-00742]
MDDLVNDTVSTALPVFPYHPDPLATGSVVADPDTVCPCCARARGHVYTGPVHTASDEDLHGRLCPWCIADGSAAERYGISFCGVVAGEVPEAVLTAVDRRTPGFAAWQDSVWLTHCGDAAAFLGPAGAAELTAYPDALDALRREAVAWQWSADEIERYLASFERDGRPTAYLFRCRVCGTHLAYSDFT